MVKESKTTKETKTTKDSKTSKDTKAPKESKTTKDQQTVEVKEEAEAGVALGKYFYAVGRRKSAIAQVRLFVKGKGKILVNDRDYKEYFPTNYWHESSIRALTITNNLDKFDVTVKVTGGGKRGQAEAVRLGVARALILYDVELRTIVKKAGYLKRDARKKERKKYGLKGARRAPQWSKR